MVGQTKDVGWNIGVSKTLPHPIGKVWDFMTSPEGIALWLGEGAELSPVKGTRYETADGTVGEIRGYHEHDRIRLTLRPGDWDHDTTMQFAMVANGDRTMLRFHQEWLADAEEREHQREHWQGVMDAVVEALKQLS
ncbi:SRPBCC family protein [Actinokineospora sp. HUAS TT18]|uniref:SRPBCC family protein n=1 Tax=Actinokineospora sp. HUAS TT18 TaxID=3447451 RepID=UPI003F52776E